MIREVAIFAALVCGFQDDRDAAAPNSGSSSAPRGHLVIVGGGPAVDEIYRRTLAIAGGPDARVLVVPFASPRASAAAGSAALWQTIGAKNVSVLDVSDRAAALEAVRAADLIWFRGGEQQRLMHTLEQTEGLIDAIRERYVDGATIGGTSAGAAVMSRLMIAGPAGRRGTPEAKLARFGSGLGLWPDVIVDQHFVRRKRHARLESAVRTNPTLLGIGIDEATAVIVNNGREFEVVGLGPVIIYDARAVAPVGAPGPNTPVDAEVTMVVDATAANPPAIASHTLKAGMRFHLDHGLLADNAAVASETTASPPTMAETTTATSMAP